MGLWDDPIRGFRSSSVRVDVRQWFRCNRVSGLTLCGGGELSLGLVWISLVCDLVWVSCERYVVW